MQIIENGISHSAREVECNRAQWVGGVVEGPRLFGDWDKRRNVTIIYIILQIWSGF